jgi:hypothetical protein
VLFLVPDYKLGKRGRKVPIFFTAELKKGFRKIVFKIV